MHRTRPGSALLTSIALTLLAVSPVRACPDADADGVCDADDNCSTLANADQLDVDLDGYGNRCDGDLDGDGRVSAADLLSVFLPSLGSADPQESYDLRADADGSGYVSSGDYQVLLAQFVRDARPGPSGLACAGAPPCAAASLPPPAQAEHVLARLGYGADAWSRARIAQLGVVGFIQEQLRPALIAEDPRLEDRLAQLPSLSLDVAQLFASYDDPTPLRELKRARVLRILLARRQLEELLVDFWFDHFNVFAGGGNLTRTVVAFERDAIRPHVLGRFVDLLRATARSPAMLEYLDNRFNVADGLNENYARELLELHTLGTGSGFSQRDVLETARALTGWGVYLAEASGFRFRADRHDDGEKTLLWTLRIPAGSGEQGGEALLAHLAARPETSVLVAERLVARFVDEKLPTRVVAAAAQRFRVTQGDLAAVMETILLSPEFLVATEHRRSKVKRPAVLVGSLARALGADPDVVAATLESQLASLGESPFYARPPTGYPDESQAWASPGNLVIALNTIERAARGLEGYAPVYDLPYHWHGILLADGLIESLLPGGASAATRNGAIALAHALRRHPRAERLEQVAAYLLSSPEFLLH